MAYLKYDRYAPIESAFINTDTEWSNARLVHKFGRNLAVTSMVPVTIGGVFNTPQPAAATTLRVKAGNTNDTSAGSGARTIALEGLDETGALVEETLTTNGTSAGSAGSVTFTRLFRAFVATSGTYATSAAGSHAADIVIENGAGGTDWLTIDSTDYPRGQSEVAAYSVPLGETAHIMSITTHVQSTKPADIILFKRGGIDDSAPPYEGWREQVQFSGVDGGFSLKPATPLGPYVAGTDLVFLAQAGTSAEVSIDFEIILTKD